MLYIPLSRRKGRGKGFPVTTPPWPDIETYKDPRRKYKVRYIDCRKPRGLVSCVSYVDLSTETQHITLRGILLVSDIPH